MIQPETILKIADNTGAKIGKCFKVLGGSKRRYASLGDIIVISIKKASPRGIVRKKSIERAVIVRMRNQQKRPDGSCIRFDENAVVIINKEGLPKGTRVFGPVARELREKGFQKIISQAPDVL